MRYLFCGLCQSVCCDGDAVCFHDHRQQSNNCDRIGIVPTTTTTTTNNETMSVYTLIVIMHPLSATILHNIW